MPFSVACLFTDLSYYKYLYLLLIKWGILTAYELFFRIFEVNFEHKLHSL